MNPNLKLLLISNSLSQGRDYLDHCKTEIKDFLKGKDSILFVPYALKDRDKYSKTAMDFYNTINIQLRSLHTSKNPQKEIENAQAIMVGGGNTFRLLNELYKLNLIPALQSKINSGTPYIGTSAGANIACPTIKTTNDMPIVQTPSLNALGFVPFQINPHYIDPDPKSTHMGETRAQRIKEFHEENEIPVIGLREGAWLRIENNEIKLGGKTGVKVFYKDRPSIEYASGLIIL